MANISIYLSDEQEERLKYALNLKPRDENGQVQSICKFIKSLVIEAIEKDSVGFEETPAYRFLKKHVL